MCDAPLSLNMDESSFVRSERSPVIRADMTALVLYTSLDGKNWSEATRLRELPKSCGCYYSNNLVMNHNGKNRMLIQFSEGYDHEWCVNVYHIWLTIE